MKAALHLPNAFCCAQVKEPSAPGAGGTSLHPQLVDFVGFLLGFLLGRLLGRVGLGVAVLLGFLLGRLLSCVGLGDGLAVGCLDVGFELVGLDLVGLGADRVVGLTAARADDGVAFGAGVATYPGGAFEQRYSGRRCVEGPTCGHKVTVPA